MLLFTFICSILLLNVPIFQAQCVYETDVDYFGTDLTVVFLPTIDGCCNLCGLYPGCNSYTYVRDIGACWLKSATVPNRFTSPGRTSGLRTPGTVVTPVAPTTTNSPTTTVTSTTTPTTPATVTTTTVAGVTTPATTLSVATTTLLTTTGVATTTKKFGCFVENDINYIGNDLRSQYVDSMGDCCNLCGATNGCVVWAYWSTFKFCYLKNALPSLNQRQSFTNMFSGLVTLR